MFFESIAILIVILLILIIFIREHCNEYAKTAVILMILPGTYILSYIITLFVDRFFHIQNYYIVFVGIIIGLIITCFLIGLMAYHIKRKSLKIMYICMNGLILLSLTIIMLLDLSFV